MTRLTLHLVPEDTSGTPTTRPRRTCPPPTRRTGSSTAPTATPRWSWSPTGSTAADPRPFLLLTLDLERTGSPWRFDDPERALPARLRPDRPGLGRRGAAHGALGRRRLHRSRAALTPAGSALALPARLRRLVGVDRLAIQDLLEHLAHPGTHERAAGRLGVVVTSPVAGHLARVELLVHGGNRPHDGRARQRVNRDSGRFGEAAAATAPLG